MAVDVGEAEVPALVFGGELFVIDTEEVEGGGVEVVDVEGVLSGGEAEGSGPAVGDATFDASAGHKHGARFGVVVAAAALGHWSATKFANPDDEGVVEHAAFLEVLDQGGGSLVDVFAACCHALDDATVVVPAGVIKLDEADAALSHASGHEAI